MTPSLSSDPLPEGATAPRLLVILPSLDPGGAERQLLGISKCLSEGGVEVEFLLLRNAGKWFSRAARNGIRARSAGVDFRRRPITSILNAFRLIAYLRRVPPDAVLAVLYESVMVGLPLVRIAVPGARRFVGIRGYLPRRRRLTDTWLRIVLQNSDGIIVNSSHLVNDLEEAIGPLSVPVVCIENCVIPRQAHKPEFGGEFRVVVISNLIHYKGLDLLVDAVSRLPMHPDVRFDIIGEGHLRQKLEHEIEVRQLQTRIRLLGSVEDPQVYLDDAHFAVHASRTEGQSNAVLEELASGLPVIAFRVPGMDRLITNEFNGFLVDAFDVDALAARIQLLMAKPDVLACMSQNALRSVSDRSFEVGAGSYAHAMRLN